MKCIAVDDEPLALQQIEIYAKSIPFIEMVRTCKSTTEALEVLSNQKIDLMLIDINMPDINGVDFVKSLANPPMVIFTTAHAQYALQGFKVDAVDYVLKPFSVGDLIKACNKAQLLFDLRQKAAAYEPSDFLTGVPNSELEDDFIFVKSDYKIVRIKISDILYVESMSEYVRIFLNNDVRKSVVTLISMNKLEEQLAPKGFMRVHRSYLVNLEKVNIVSKMRIVFDKEVYIPIGDMYKEKFIKYVNSHFIGKE